MQPGRMLNCQKVVNGSTACSAFSYRLEREVVSEGTNKSLPIHDGGRNSQSHDLRMGLRHLVGHHVAIDVQSCTDIRVLHRPE
jgi:hypothetical protein